VRRVAQVLIERQDRLVGDGGIVERQCAVKVAVSRDTMRMRGLAARIPVGAKMLPLIRAAHGFPAGRGAIFLMSAIWLGAKGTVTAEMTKFFVMGLPRLLAGTWLGLKLFGRIDEATFRKIVLALLLVPGVTLLF
jgi:uncharacterized protein